MTTTATIFDKLGFGPKILRSPPAAYESFTLVPQSPTIGAEVRGLDLSRLTPASHEFEELYAAFLDWKVLVFRECALTCAELGRFAHLWGEPFLYEPDGSAKGTFGYKPVQDDVPEVSSLGGDPDDPERFERDFAGYQNVWHTDGVELLMPAKAAILRCVKIPPVGGDTLWADMAAAYDNLPDDIKHAIADRQTIYADTTMIHGPGCKIEHPTVRTHPETGRKILLADRLAEAISGLEPLESDRLLEILKLQARVPEYQYRLRWEPGTMAVWDEISTQHYACSDFRLNGGVRVMERCEIRGDHEPF